MNKNNYSGCNDISNNNFSVISAEKAIEWIYLGNPMRRICLQHITAKVQILR